MERYNVLHDREIVLLKGFSCFWGKCSFCDYIIDNCNNEADIIKTNNEVLNQVTGVRSALEIINSGSCFELPKETLNKIKTLVKTKKINKLVFESHWNYRKRLNEIREFFGVPIMFKVGIETFNNDFRNNILNKNAQFKNAKEVSEYFDSVCLLIGIKGQTKDMVANDIDLLLKYFKHGTINIFTENSTDIKRDQDLIDWFTKEYKYLAQLNNIDWLNLNTDFGVGK